ncbi:hypothetical protein CUMW_058300, partial [Citrus unshiu]
RFKGVPIALTHLINVNQTKFLHLRQPVIHPTTECSSSTPTARSLAITAITQAPQPHPIQMTTQLLSPKMSPSTNQTRLGSAYSCPVKRLILPPRPSFPLFLYPNTAATPDPNDDTIALSKDVPVNQSNNTWVRIIPAPQALDSSTDTKFPPRSLHPRWSLLLLSAATKIYHDLCSEIASRVPAIIVSVDYRLAPEHRLPAAYDDAVEVLQWVKTTQEHWLRQYADFSSCFIMADGGNIAYTHATAKQAHKVDDLSNGLILPQAFFGGSKRTESGLRLANHPTIYTPPQLTDCHVAVALPIGADRDR